MIPICSTNFFASKTYLGCGWNNIHISKQHFNLGQQSPIVKSLNYWVCGMCHVMHPIHKRIVLLHILCGDTCVLDYHYIYPKTNKFVYHFYFTHPTNVNLWLYTIKHVILFKIAPSITYCRFNKTRTLFHYSTTYTWTDNQDWLLRVITSSQPTKINWSFGTTFIACKMMLCTSLAMD